jgi:hypothetical protein
MSLCSIGCEEKGESKKSESPFGDSDTIPTSLELNVALLFFGFGDAGHFLRDGDVDEDGDLVFDLEELSRLDGRQDVFDLTMVFLEQVEAGVFVIKPALGHLGGFFVVEGPAFLGLDEIADEIGAVEGLFGQVELVFVVNGPKLVRLRLGEFHDLVDHGDFGGVNVAAEKLELLGEIVADIRSGGAQCDAEGGGEEGEKFGFHI